MSVWRGIGVFLQGLAGVWRTLRGGNAGAAAISATRRGQAGFIITAAEHMVVQR